MNYDILDDQGNVINCIISSRSFVEKVHPNRFKISDRQDVIGLKPDPEHLITKSSFWLRFPAEEQASVLNAQNDPEVSCFLKTFRVIESIPPLESEFATDLNVSLTDHRVRGFLEILRSKGLISTKLENRILSSPINDNERPS